MDAQAIVERVPGAVTDEAFGQTTVDVPVEHWAQAVAVARELGCDFFDFLSAVDDPDGPLLVCHLAASDPFGHVLLRTRLDPQSPQVESVEPSYAGAGWHERETAEMFGITFTSEGSPLQLDPLLLPPGLSGHPLRKEFALQARLDRPWPGAKEPGE